MTLAAPLIPASRCQLADLGQLAAIPEEEIWLASQKRARTRRAYLDFSGHSTDATRNRLTTSNTKEHPHSWSSALFINNGD